MQISSTAAKQGMNIYSPDMVMRARPSDDRLEQSKAAASAAAAERQVLARENALRARVPGASTHTTYTYATGPDGRRYITGAEVSIVGTEDQLRGSGGSGGRPAGMQIDYAKQGGGASMMPSAGAGAAAAKRAGAYDKLQDPEVKKQIQKLQQREREVIAHEAAHMAAGGELAGGASYTYTTGPDGKRYITGGSVPITLPATSDPEEALRNAQRMLAAATAPSSPSGPDMAVAASAAQIASQARIDMATQSASSAPDGTATVGGDDPDGTFDSLRGSQAKDAYAQTASPKGLWTRSAGQSGAQSPVPGAEEDEEDERGRLDIAA